MKIDDRAKREKDFFDNLAKGDREYWGCETQTGRLRLKLRGQYIKKTLKKKHGVTLLDLGCGLGALTQHLTQISGKIYAVDISSQSISTAKSKIKSNKIIFKSDNAHNLSFRSNFFDAIVGNSILHHINLEKALSEVFRTLKKDGQIVFFEPNYINPQVFLERRVPFIRNLARNSKDETAFIRWSLKRALEESGFKNIKVEPYDFLYPALPLNIAKKLIKISNLLEKTFLIKELSGSLKITATK